MDAFIPLLLGSGGPVSIVQVKQATTYQATFDAPPTAGNKIFCLHNNQQTATVLDLAVGGLTPIAATVIANSAESKGAARLGYRDVEPGDPAGPYGSSVTASNNQVTLFEVAGLPAGGPLNTVTATDQAGTGVSRSITPAGGVDAWLVGAFGSELYAAFGGTPTFTPNGATTAIGNLTHHSGMFGNGQPFYGESAGGAVTLGGTQGGTTEDPGNGYRYGIQLAAFATTGGSLTFPAAPDTVDGSDSTSDDVDNDSVAAASGVFWRADLGSDITVGRLRIRVGLEDPGPVTIFLQAGDASDWSDAADEIQIDLDATGGLAADEYELVWEGEPFRYWQLVLDGAAQDVRVFEVELEEAPGAPDPVTTGKAILEIYVHDEDASRWGTATWATGPATGTEGIWSAAGWQDVTPQGVNAHIIWGSRRPGRGILAEQDPASWNVETYDPDRVLDPGNQDSPYWPQLVAGIPIRISHDTLVIRTGVIDELRYAYKPPAYRGQILASDTIALMHRASVPADSILGDTLLERISDAINAAGIAVGGIPIPPAGPTGPAIAEWIEGAALDDPTTVWDHVRKAAQEVLWVAYIQADAGLGLRSWGAPLDRGREISAPNLEDLEDVVNEDGVYSVARVQVADPDLDPIEREASPLPRYGRRMIERREPTVDAEGWADAVLSERSWPGVQYVPGAIHCFTGADVDYFGSLEIMERVTVTHPGVVSVQGRILGGELWVEHLAGATQGAKWIFRYAVATDGSTAIGLTTLVADGTGEVLLDDATETDYLEAD